MKQLIQSFTLFCFSQSKSYVTSHVDDDVFKLLYESFLHQLSSIIASTIGTTLFAHVNFEYIFVPQKSKEATLLFLQSAQHYCTLKPKIFLYWYLDQQVLSYTSEHDLFLHDYNWYILHNAKGYTLNKNKGETHVVQYDL